MRLKEYYKLITSDFRAGLIFLSFIFSFIYVNNNALPFKEAVRLNNSDSFGFLIFDFLLSFTIWLGTVGFLAVLITSVVTFTILSIPFEKIVSQFKSYIDNANLIQKAFLFIGIVAFIFWCSVIDIDALFSRDFIEQLFYKDSRYSGTNPTKVYSVWTMILSIIGSYIFKDNPK